MAPACRENLQIASRTARVVAGKTPVKRNRNARRTDAANDVSRYRR